VVIQGVRLKEETDYEISGDYSATEEGEYYITINGINDYTDSIIIQLKLLYHSFYVLLAQYHLIMIINQKDCN